MPVLAFARRVAWRACGCVGALTLAVFAAEAFLVLRDSREVRKRAGEGGARLEALLRDAGGQR